MIFCIKQISEQCRVEWDLYVESIGGYLHDKTSNNSASAAAKEC